MPGFGSLGPRSENAIKAMLTRPEDRSAAVRQLVERGDMQADGLQVRLRSEGLASLVAEPRQRPVPAEVA